VTGGVLLTGETGSGKSTLAKELGEEVRQLNTEREVVVLSCNCNHLISTTMGSSERHVRDIFDYSRVRAEAGEDVVLILENVESVCRTRDRGDSTTGGTMVRVLAQFLVEIDGVRTEKVGNGGKESGKVSFLFPSAENWEERRRN